ncbi:hypothetical protein ACFLX2_00110 [Candidatus Dependentiae bacterium]
MIGGKKPPPPVRGEPVEPYERTKTLAMKNNNEQQVSKNIFFNLEAYCNIRAVRMDSTGSPRTAEKQALLMLYLYFASAAYNPFYQNDSHSARFMVVSSHPKKICFKKGKTRDE